MANKKITELDAATSLASTDVVPVVDVSEDVTKKITTTNLFRTLPDGTAAAPALAFSSDAANGVYLAGTDTVGISTGGTQRVTVDGSGNVTISGDLTVSGATTTVESTTVTIDDKNIELGSVASPSNTTADGGGITLKASSDKTIKWINSTGYWTFNTGIEVGGHLQIDDSNEIRIGSGQDLKIYHDGSESFIDEEGTGGLTISSGTVTFKNQAKTETHAIMTANGGVDLYHNNVEKFRTKSDGINVTGEVQCDSLDVDGTVDITGDVNLHANLDMQDNDRLNIGSSNDFTIRHNGTDTHVENDTGTLFISQYQDDEDIALRSDDGSGAITNYVLCDGSEGNVRLYHYGTQKLGTKSDGVDVVGEVQCDSLDVDGAVDIDGGQIYYDAANNNLHFIDNVKARFGTGSDLRIYHDGSNSYIDDAGTGNLQIRGSSQVKIQKYTGENMFVGIADGAASMYYNNSQKIATKSDGIDVTGEVQCDSLDVDGAIDVTNSSAGSEVARFEGNYSSSGSVVLSNWRRAGGAVAGAFKYNDATTSMSFGTTTSHSLTIRTNDSDRLTIDNSGRVGIGTSSPSQLLHLNGTNPFIYVEADSTTGNSGITFADGANKGQIMYDHDGDYMRFSTNGSSNERLRIDSSGKVGIGTTSPDSNSLLTVNGVINLPDDVAIAWGGGTNRSSWSGNKSSGFLRAYTNGSERMRIDSSGRLLLGTTTEGHTDADDLTLQTSSGFTGITLRSATDGGGAIYFSDGTSGVSEYDGQILYYQSTRSMQFATAGTTRLTINSNGAWGIEGANNYGTSGQVLTSNGNDAPTWQDAGAGSVGGANAISMNDNVKINFGNSSDLQIHHDGTHSRINDNGSGSLLLQTNGSSIQLNKGTSENMLVANIDADVELYYNGSKKLETKSDGVDIVGELQCDSLDVDGSADISGSLDLGSELNMMGSSDSAKYLDVRLGSNTFSIRGTSGGDAGHSNLAQFTRVGPVKLFYSGSQKFQTKTDGVDVTGEVQCDSLDCDGAADFTGDATFRGGAAAVEVAANSDIRLINGSWTGDYGAKIQHHNNALYIQGGSGGFVFRDPDGTDRTQINSNGHLHPSANNTYDLGISNYRWRNIYTNDLNLSNEGGGNDVDGTWGNYTIQEGEDDLFLINRRNGKKYKFNLTEVN